MSKTIAELKAEIQNTKPVDPSKDIASTATADLLARAKANADLDDSEDARQAIARDVQEKVIALRELGRGFTGLGVTLHQSKDLFVFQKGVHPRGLQVELLDPPERYTTRDLSDLQAAVTAALEHLAG